VANESLPIPNAKLGMSISDRKVHFAWHGGRRAASVLLQIRTSRRRGTEGAGGSEGETKERGRGVEGPHVLTNTKQFYR
jgi:hypothetical protein